MFKREIDWSAPKRLKPVTDTKWDTKKIAPFLSDNMFGWISPTGEIHQVHQYAHLNFFKFYYLADKPEGIQEYFDLEKKDRSEAADRWEEGIGDAHPAWHNFDGSYFFEPCENVIARFTWIAYEAGWGRIGTFGGGKLELECADDHARKLRKHAKALAEMVGRELLVTPIAPYEEPTESQVLASTAPTP